MAVLNHVEVKNGGAEGHASWAWRPPPLVLALPPSQVHVWRASVARHCSALSELRSLLSPEEQDRADRFQFAADRDRFVAAHGLLHVLLARYLRETPGRIVFEQNPFGKPALAPSIHHEDLRFNLSHSEGLVLYAFTRGREVGVDVERIRPVPDFERIAEQYFSLAERAELGALGSECKLDGFFAFWTLKEAYIKALGQGLSVPLHDFSVSLQPDAVGRLLRHAGADCECGRWSLQRLTPGPGYAGALAVEGHDWELACWDVLGEPSRGGIKDEG